MALDGIVQPVVFVLDLARLRELKKMTGHSDVRFRWRAYRRIRNC
jgi:hypothetical protein